MAKHRCHSIEFKRQVAQEYLAGDTLHVYSFRSNLTGCDGGVSSPSVDIEYRSQETTR